MFHIGNLTSNECLKHAWKAANDIDIETDEEYDLPEICRNLDTWISSETFDTRRRLSLRTSATLISGISRMYKNGVHKLFEDVKALDTNMSRRKRANPSVSSGSFDGSDLAPTPEQMRRQHTYSVDSSITPIKRSKTDSTSSMGATPSYVMSESSNESNTNVDNNSSNVSGILSIGNSSKSPENTEEPSQISPENSRRGQAVQTSPTIDRSNRDHNSSEEHVLDKDLPFGYILIHDNYHSRMPSRIILSSINSAIKDLI